MELGYSFAGTDRGLTEAGLGLGSNTIWEDSDRPDPTN
jgi:hypothetical protein